MPPDAKKYLYDMQQAVDLLTAFTEGATFVDYEGNAMLRAAVERQFEIVGEALAERIGEHRRIIAFRNILIHGYAQVDNRLVWDIVQSKLPTLRREIAALLPE